MAHSTCLRLSCQICRFLPSMLLKRAVRRPPGAARLTEPRDGCPVGARQLRGSRGLDTCALAAHHADIAGGISIGIQMSELMRLLLKAVRSLPQDEQDTVLTELLGAKVVGGRPEQPTGHFPRLELGWAGLTGIEVTSSSSPSEAGERLSPFSPRLRAGGPWQTVPTRLSVEQYDRLKQWCQANNFTMAVVLRGLVDRFLDEQARRPKSDSGEGSEASA